MIKELTRFTKKAKKEKEKATRPEARKQQQQYKIIKPLHSLGLQQDATFL